MHTKIKIGVPNVVSLKFIIFGEFKRKTLEIGVIANQINYDHFAKDFFN